MRKVNAVLGLGLVMQARVHSPFVLMVLKSLWEPSLKESPAKASSRPQDQAHLQRSVKIKHNMASVSIQI